MKLPTWSLKQDLFRAVGYEPQPEQGAMHRDRHRFRLVAGGERGGKSYSTAMEGLSWWPYGRLIWLVGEQYEDARKEFEYIAESLGRLGAIDSSSMPMYGPQRLTTKQTHTVYKTVSAQRLVKIGREAPDGILVCEAAQLSYAAVLKVFGRSAERRAPVLFSGTFEGSLGWYPEYYEKWASGDGGQSFSLPTWSNRAIFPGGRDDPEIKALESTYPPDLFMERFGAVPCPPATLVFKEFAYQSHVRDCPVHPKEPVELAIDPGYAGAYAVEVLQVQGGEVWVVDEVYRRGAVAAEVIAECEARPWWKQVRGGVIDIAGRQHHALPSHVEIWAAAGVPLRSNVVGIEDGIARMRTFLRDPGTSEPRLFLDSRLRSGVDRAGFPLGVLAEFGLYRYPEVRENRPVKEQPIDRDNHGLKALGYWLYDRYGPVERRPTPPPTRRDYPWKGVGHG